MNEQSRANLGQILAQAVLIIGLLAGGIASPVAAQDAPPHVGADSLYPDSTLTPGAVFDDVGAEQVCVAGYASSVRNVTSAERAQVYAEYGVDNVPGADEVDHFIPLELGGSNDITNLWPEPYLPAPGAHDKDRVENYLHDLVCSGAMALADAQAAIAADWYAVFVTLPAASDVAPGATEGHTFYASSFATADTIYCDTDPGWKSLSPRYLVSFPSLDEALAALPGYHLHRPC
jgi:hypothetical protein